MERRDFLFSSTALMALSQLKTLSSMFNLTAFEMIPLRRNVGVFVDKGGTIGWLIQKDNIVVIDSQFREQANHFIEEVNRIQNCPIRYLINTHHHADHTSGNIAFKGLARNVLSHENSRINQINTAVKNASEAQQLYPDMTYTERWQETCGDETIDIQYWGPAHTNGDSIIHFQQANIVHCGDLMFNGRYPVIDKTTGARIDNWIEILQRMQSEFSNDTKFIFGHAGEGYSVIGTKDDLAVFADYLRALLEFVESEGRAGKSKEEIMRTTSIPGAPQWKSGSIDRSLSAAIEELGIH